MIPRYKLYGLGVITYDAGNSNYMEYVDIITSEYDPDTGKFGELGTVFSILARGYDVYINSGDIDKCQDIRFDGASRVCTFPTTTGNSHPQQVDALLGFYSDMSSVFFPGYYLTEDSGSHNANGYHLTSCGSTKPDRFYLTTVYGLAGENNIAVYVSTDPTFQDAWVECVCGVADYDRSYNADWVMAYVTAVPYTGEKSFKGRVSVNELSGTVDAVQKFKCRVSEKKFSGTIS